MNYIAISKLLVSLVATLALISSHLEAHKGKVFGSAMETQSVICRQYNGSSTWQQVTSTPYSYYPNSTATTSITLNEYPSSTHYRDIIFLFSCP